MQNPFPNNAAESRAEPGGGWRVLHTPDAFARRALLHLQEIGELAPDGPWRSSREGLASHLLVVVESGSGVFCAGNERCELKAGDLAFVDCRNSHSHETGPDPWRLLWIHFGGPQLAEFSSEWTKRTGGFKARASKPEAFRRLWEEMRSAAVSADPLRDYRLNESLAAVLTLLAESGFGTDCACEGRRQARLSLVKEWIEENCTRRSVSLDDLAKIACVNKFTLVRDFRARYGTTPKRALAQARTDRAKALLRFTDDTVEAIGAQCGVPDPNYFARMFRRVEGIPPGEFRFRWREGAAARGGAISG